MTTVPIISFADFTGLVGVVFYLLSYGLLQSGLLRQNSISYSVLNLLAATLVLISLTTDFHLASAIIQLLWIIISLSGLLRIWLMQTQHKATSQQPDHIPLVELRCPDQDRVQVTIDENEMQHQPACVARKTRCGAPTDTVDTHDSRGLPANPWVWRSVELIDLGEPSKPLMPDVDLGHTGLKLAKNGSKTESHAQPCSAWKKINTAVEHLPPFWAAFALTLTETVGAGTLALPIAIATIGPLAGVAVLVFLGLINLITVTYLAEACARNGSLPYGSAFVGRLVSDFLGPTAAFMMRLALFAFCCIVLASYFTGFASTLSAATGVAEPVWATVICGVGLLLIVGNNLTGTLASALLVGAINILVILILSLLAFQHASFENLLSTGYPATTEYKFEPSRLQLVFGVILVSYFGHLSVSNCAQTVLRRDPDGRSLKRGTAAAMLTAIVIYCFWSLAIGGAIDSERLHAETGTALVPLAEQLGPHIHILGIVFAVLGLGMSSVHYGLGIVNMSREIFSGMTNQNSPSGLAAYLSSCIAILPILAVFAYVQWTYFKGTASFTAPLELLGALVAPVLAGIFPVLLLLASRSQGLSTVDARVSRVTSHPVVLALVIFLSFAAMVSHAIMTWQEPLSRTAGIVVALSMGWLITDLCRRRVFSPMMRMDIRHCMDDDHAMVKFTFAGRPIIANLALRHHDGSMRTLPIDGGIIRDFSAVKELEIAYPSCASPSLQVHAYQIHGGFEAVPLAGSITMLRGKLTRQTIRLETSNGITRLDFPTKVHNSKAVAITIAKSYSAP